MFMALLSPYSYFGREGSPSDIHLWTLGPSEGPGHWPAIYPDSGTGIPCADLWRAHVRNLGGS